jgi:hypothetical protein
MTLISNAGTQPIVERRGTAPRPDAVSELIASDIKAQRALTLDALKQLGISGVPERAARPGAISKPHTNGVTGEISRAQLRATLASLAERPANRQVPLPLGTLLRVGPGDDQVWAVIGAQGASVELAQRTTVGEIARTSRPWASLVEYNPSLLDGPIIDATRGVWKAKVAPEASYQGRAAVTELVSPASRLASASHHAAPITTTWHDVIEAAQLTQRTPLAVMPSNATQVFELRALLGDNQFVLSAAGETAGHPRMLVGTESRPGTAAPALSEAHATQDWFKRVTGLDIWESERPFVLHTNDRDFVANAAAASVDGTSMTLEGPRSERVRGTWLEQGSGDYGQMERRISKLIQEHDVAVRTHEGGHVASLREWGDTAQRMSRATSATQVVEEGIVGEAIADLFGAARAGKPDVGVRALGTLQHGGQHLDVLRAGIKADAENFDVHFGTQLLTKPMVKVQRELGSDALGEITGAAVRRLGRDLMNGAGTPITLPEAAQALRDATAWRHGADSTIVRHLDESWRLLGMLK